MYVRNLRSLSLHPGFPFLPIFPQTVLFMLVDVQTFVVKVRTPSGRPAGEGLADHGSPLQLLLLLARYRTHLHFPQEFFLRQGWVMLLCLAIPPSPEEDQDCSDERSHEQKAAYNNRHGDPDPGVRFRRAFWSVGSRVDITPRYDRHWYGKIWRPN